MTLWWLLSNSHNIHCAKSEEKKCPKPVISNVDVSTNKIYFSAPNAYTVAVSSSSDKIKWTSGHGWPESPRSITYLQHYIKITSLCKGWESESDIFEVNRSYTLSWVSWENRSKWKSIWVGEIYDLYGMMG